MLEMIPAETAALVDEVRALFLEYAASIEFDLSLQGFEQELAGLPGDYAAPSGSLLLAIDDGRPAGCVAMRRMDDATVEMKRLYVRPAFRGKAIGKRLVTEIVARARSAGYQRMRLDTLPTMTEAIALYRASGFAPIAPYHAYPIEDVVFLELRLAP